MPRATAFTRADIKERAKLFGEINTVIPVDLTEQQQVEFLDIIIMERIEEAIRRKTDAFTPETFKPLSYVIPENRHTDCLDAINLAFRCYKLDLVAVVQERPARKVEAFRRVQRALARSPKAFREELARLPTALRQDLGFGDLHYFVNRLAERIAYWQRHVCAYRPADKNWARLKLTEAVAALGADFSPDTLAKSEPKRRQWTAEVMRSANIPGLKVLDEKKRKQKFTGYASPRSRGVE